jgi:BirA family transcriptional regulator, biotin operon repressor / biotin---[acetyl-CoA-carboxylase] ligase
VVSRADRARGAGIAGGGSAGVLAIDPGVIDAALVRAVARKLVEPGVAQRARIVAHLAGEGVVSGQALAIGLGVSRAAVHKHIEALRQRGLCIDSTPGAGYTLDELPWDLLVPEVVLPLLLGSGQCVGGSVGEGPVLGLPYSFVVETESTNQFLRDSGQSIPTGAVVATDFQAQGRGRMGRRWVSEPGRDLTFSVMLRPHVAPVAASQLVLAASVAVADVLGALPGIGERVGIKWPNDVLIDGRKVCGILSEASMDMDSVHWLILGIGVNVNSRPAAALAAAGVAPGAAAPRALIEVVGAAQPRGQLLTALLERLAYRLSQVERGRFDEVLAVFSAHDVLLGKSVVVRSGFRGADVVAAGAAAGFAPGGELLVRRADGSTAVVAVGEVTLAAPWGGPQPD